MNSGLNNIAKDQNLSAKTEAKIMIIPKNRKQEDMVLNVLWDPGHRSLHKPVRPLVLPSLVDRENQVGLEIQVFQHHLDRPTHR